LHHRPPVAPSPELQQTQSRLKRVARSLNIFKGRKKRCPDTLSVSFGPNHHARETNVQEVWFAGCHSDVGGGNAKDSKRHALSNVPLRWMLREINLNLGGRIHFDPTALKQWDIPLAIIEPPSTGMVREASSATYCEDAPRENAMPDVDEYRDAPEQEKAAFAIYGKSVADCLAAEESLDAGDAVKKPRDELKKNVFWWVLEVFPTYYKSQNEQGQWIWEWRPHWGRGRKLPLDPLFHESVRTRMHDPFLHYSPRAQYPKHSETYVV